MRVGTMDRDFTAHIWIKENTSCECILLFKDKPGKCRIVGEMYGGHYDERKPGLGCSL